MTALAAYEEALLSGASCWVETGGRRLPLPVHRWRAAAGPDDEVLLAASAATCGPVIDVGCGPGRMTEELGRRGVPAYGIDLSSAAVGIARGRGVLAQRRTVFGPLPAEGRWRCVLLADGNIGIGGDPVALLQRCRDLLAPEGVVVADLLPGMHRIRRGVVRLGAIGRGGPVGGVMPWATVHEGAAEELGSRCGLRVVSVVRAATGAVVVWGKESARG